MIDDQYPQVKLGMLIENWRMYGIPNDKIYLHYRRDIIDYIESFEECYLSFDELEELSPEELIYRSYWILSEYCKSIN